MLTPLYPTHRFSATQREPPPQTATDATSSERLFIKCV